MKKLFFIPFFCLFLFGCVSNNIEAADSFTTEYNDIKDVTYIVHDNLKIGMLYNLRDSLTGERENIRLYIANNNLFLSVNYQYKNWAFFDSAVFLANGARLKINLNNRISDVISGTVVREQYDSILSDKEIDLLLNILSSDVVEVAFTGSKVTSDKFKIPPKVSSAMIATINKYNEIK